MLGSRRVKTRCGLSLLVDVLEQAFSASLVRDVNAGIDILSLLIIDQMCIEVNTSVSE